MSINPNSLSGSANRAVQTLGGADRSSLRSGRLSEIIQRVQSTATATFVQIANDFCFEGEKPIDQLDPMKTIDFTCPVKIRASAMETAVKVAICASCLTASKRSALPAINTPTRFLAAMGLAAVGLAALGAEAGLIMGGAVGVYAVHQALSSWSERRRQEP